MFFHSVEWISGAINWLELMQPGIPGQIGSRASECVDISTSIDRLLTGKLLGQPSKDELTTESGVDLCFLSGRSPQASCNGAWLCSAHPLAVGSMSQGLLISGCCAAYGDLVMMDHSFSPWLGFAIAGTVIAPAVSLYLFRVAGSDLDAADAVFLDLRFCWSLHKPFLLRKGLSHHGLLQRK